MSGVLNREIVGFTHRHSSLLLLLLSSFSLVVKNFKEEDQVLSFGKLTANIIGASYKKKDNRIIITLKKENEGEWHTVNDKGTPEHEIV